MVLLIFTLVCVWKTWWWRGRRRVGIGQCSARWGSSTQMVMKWVSHFSVASRPCCWAKGSTLGNRDSEGTVCFPLLSGDSFSWNWSFLCFWVVCFYFVFLNQIQMYCRPCSFLPDPDMRHGEFVCFTDLSFVRLQQRRRPCTLLFHSRALTITKAQVHQKCSQIVTT